MPECRLRYPSRKKTLTDAKHANSGCAEGTRLLQGLTPFRPHTHRMQGKRLHTRAAAALPKAEPMHTPVQPPTQLGLLSPGTAPHHASTNGCAPPALDQPLQDEQPAQPVPPRPENQLGDPHGRRHPLLHTSKSPELTPPAGPLRCGHARLTRPRASSPPHAQP